MKVKIAKWGNSLGVRLPKRFSDELGLAPGRTVELQKDGTRVSIETATARRIPRYELQDLLAQITPGAAPKYEDWGILPSEWPEEDWSDLAPKDDQDAAPRRRTSGGVIPGRARKRAASRRST